MSTQQNKSRGKYNGRGRGNERGGGLLSPRDNGGYGGHHGGRGQSSSYAIPKEEEDDSIFDYYPNRVDTGEIYQCTAQVMRLRGCTLSKTTTEQR